MTSGQDNVRGLEVYNSWVEQAGGRTKGTTASAKQSMTQSKPPPATGSESNGAPQNSGAVLKHASGELHVTGEAEYVDDIPHPPSMLHSWIVGAAVAQPPRPATPSRAP